MLNVDKYREEFLKVIEDDSAVCLTSRFLTILGVDVNCRISCGDCTRSLLGMLFSEYEPPLLENGDGLKPGDWIMVKDPDNEVWVKKIFAYYYDGRFYCANDIAFFKNGLLVNRTKARLPEDGE